jgi:CO/xanthine dehydrogenase FAD-binding subunit
VMQPRPVGSGEAARATTLREIGSLGFMHRERTRFFAGSSALLGVVLEPVSVDGFIVDVRGVEELQRIVVMPDGGVTAGAFASLEALAQAAPVICPSDATLVQVRMRLALLGARVSVHGLGRTRIAPVDALQLAPYELPVTLEVAAPRVGVGIAERRRTTHDGEISFALGVTAALRVSVLGRFEHVRLIVNADGELLRAAQAEAKLERTPCDSTLFPEAARLAAGVWESTDARSSAMARALPGLVVACLREALEAARPKPDPTEALPQRVVRAKASPKKKRFW